MGFKPSRITRQKSPDTNWVGGWVCPRDDLGTLEKRYICFRGGSRSTFSSLFIEQWVMKCFNVIEGSKIVLVSLLWLCVVCGV
jgi:hypothetical protein